MRDHRDYSNASWQELIEFPEFQRWVNAPSSADLEFWADFLKQFPEQQGAVEKGRDFLKGVRTIYQENDPTEVEMSTDRQQVMQKITRRRHLRRRNTRWYTAAAAAILLLTVTVMALWQPFGDVTTTAELISQNTAFGETKHIVLPDGSFVELNANSTLSYPKDWDGISDREVRLAGEAFFTVTSQPSTGAKFTVVTEDLAVEVLGTRFNVNTYLTETEVVLNEGKIQLYLYQQPDRVVAPLSPGELFRFNATSTQIERTTVDTLAYTGWKDGEYVFEDTPLGEIIDKLSAVYGVEFVLGSEALRDVKVSTTASAENLDEFLRVLSLLFTGDQISVERQGNQISIQKNEPPM